MAGKDEAILQAGEHEVRISHPDRVVFPEPGLTKLDLARYYVAVADGALRGAGGRPMVLKRFVKGIDAETREAAKEAARRAGMTLGAWLNAIILDQSEDDDPPQPLPVSRRRTPSPAVSRRRPAGSGEMAEKLDSLADKLNALTESERETAVDRFMESPRTMEESERLVNALAPHPVMINVLPNGLTGNYKVSDCKRLGFKLAIYPCTGFSVSFSSICVIWNVSQRF